MNRIPALCALLVSALVPAISSAAVNMYLQIKDAKGAARVVVSPRDPATGMASGKRMHKPITITAELGRSGAGQNSIAIDAGAAVTARSRC